MDLRYMRDHCLAGMKDGSQVLNAACWEVEKGCANLVWRVVAFEMWNEGGWGSRTATETWAEMVKRVAVNPHL